MITVIGLQCINCGHVWYRSPGDGGNELVPGTPGKLEVSEGNCPNCSSVEIHAWEVAKDGARAG